MLDDQTKTESFNKNEVSCGVSHFGVHSSIVIMTRPTAVTFKLTDAVGDARVGLFLDIAEIRLVKEKDSLILVMEACENIPTQTPKYDGVGDVYCYFFFSI